MLPRRPPTTRSSMGAHRARASAAFRRPSSSAVPRPARRRSPTRTAAPRRTRPAAFRGLTAPVRSRARRARSPTSRAAARRAVARSTSTRLRRPAPRRSRPRTAGAALKDCVPGSGSSSNACNGYFRLDTDTGEVVVEAGHVTTTVLTCANSVRNLNQSTTCTVTVTDTGKDTNNANVTKVNPTGTALFSVSNGNGTFSSVACTLTAKPATSDQSTCTFTYTPTSLGIATHTLKASYGGDTFPTQFAASSGTYNLAINSAPTNIALSPSSVAENQSSGTTVGTLTTTDPDAGNTFTYTKVVGSGDDDNALFTITGDVVKTAASFNYEVKNSYTIRVRTTDQGGLFFEKALTIAITDVNDPPTTTSKGGGDTAAVTAAENTTAVTTVTATDPDAGTTLTYSISGGADATKFSIGPTSGVLTFVTAPNYEAPTDANGDNVYEVTVKASDGSLFDTQAISVTVTDVEENTAPTCASPQSGATPEDTPLNDSVLCADAQSDTLTYTKLSGPSHGALTLNANGTFTYTPDANYNGPDSFTFKANDGIVDSNVATFNITVGAVNDAPVAVNDSALTDEDTAVDIGVSANDTDVDNLNSALRVNAGSIANVHGGTASLLPDGRTVRFTPAANANDGNTPSGFGFTYKAYDGALASANDATVSISVAAVNDAPVAVDDSASTDEDTAVAKDVVANDTDVDDDNSDLEVVASSLSATNGTASLDADKRTIRFTPALNKNDANVGPGGFTVSYKVTDGDAASAAAAKLTVSVAAVNDAPVAVDDAASTDEDTAVDKDVAANDTDVDNANSDLRVVESSIVATNGSATLLADGRTIRFTPGLNKNDGNVNSDGFTVNYKVSDGSLASAAAKLTISVAAVNDAPVAVDDSASTDEDTYVDVAVSANDTDVDTANAALRVNVGSIANVHGGSATLLADGRTVRFTPAA